MAKKPPKKDFTVHILNSTYASTFNDDEIGYEDEPKRQAFRHSCRFNLETASRTFLQKLKQQLEKTEPVEMPTGEHAEQEIKLLTPVDKILPLIQEILDRTPEIILQTVVASPEAFFQMARHLEDLQCHIELAHRQYVLPISLDLHKGWIGTTCYIQAPYWMHDHQMELHIEIDETTFKNGGLTVTQVFAQGGAPLASEEGAKTLARQTQLYHEMQHQVGKVLDIPSSIFVPGRRMWRKVIEERHLGTPETPRRLILEPELEVGIDLTKREGAILPLVRCFSPDLKIYVYAHVDELQPHHFDLKAKTRVVLPTKTRTLLDQIFEAEPTQVFGDMFGGRHGGVIVLASGNPGVGKTITAEAFAESCKRPLYVLGIGELGTTAEAVEAALSLVFDRVRRWNAVLLLDEGDIFLTKRQADDLERSAIVGVFLRVLDSYQGILMITTNRPEVLDPALLTRVTIHFGYPDFDLQARQEVWKNLLEGAGLAIQLKDLAKVAEYKLNGRLIRNVVRLIGIHYPKRTNISSEEVIDLLQYTTFEVGAKTLKNPS